MSSWRNCRRSKRCVVDCASGDLTCSVPPPAADFDTETSDIDVLVEFDVGPGYDPNFDYVGSFFGLKYGLEEMLKRPVDVVSVTSIRNPYFRDTVMRTREPLYAV